MKLNFILLVDFSENSAEMTKTAYKWSLKCGAKLTAIHQVFPIIPAFSDAQMSDHLIQAEINQKTLDLDRFVLNNLGKEALVNTQVSATHLSLQIEEIKSKNPSYTHIVFGGLKGTNILKRIFIGSQIINVINKTTTPIIAFPLGLKSFEPIKLFIAISPKFQYNCAALNNLLSLFNDKDVHLSFFSFEIQNQTEKIITMQEKIINELNGNWTNDLILFEKKSEFEELKNTLDSNKHILVLQKGSRDISDQLFRKFLVDELIFDGKSTIALIP